MEMKIKTLQDPVFKLLFIHIVCPLEVVLIYIDFNTNIIFFYVFHEK